MGMGHPTGAMLRSYAAGSASEGISLLVAAHLTYCAECRRQVAALERLAGTLFEAPEPDGAIDDLLDKTLARIDTAPPTPTLPVRDSAADAVADLPRPVLDVVGAPLSALRWRFRIPGVAELPVALGSGERVSLIRVRPGYAVPAHTHTATEATLVLKGTLCDEDRAFGVGEVAVATADHHHHPQAGKGEDCICLTVLDGGLRFTGTFGRALNLFAE